MIAKTLRRATLALSFAVAAAAAQADTLADALVGAYTHSGLLDQQRALLRVADEDVAQAQALLRPIISYEATLTQTFGTSGSLSNSLFGTSFSERSLNGADIQMAIVAQWLLFDFGASKFRQEATKEAVLGTREQLLSLEQRVMIRAVAAFYSVRQASEFVALRQNNLRLLTQELRAARDRFEVGEVTRTDVALAEAALAEARSGLAAAQGDFLQAEAEYISVTGRKPGPLSAPPPLPQPNMTIDQAIALAVRNHPDMKAAQRQVTQTELLVQAAGADLDPTVTLRGRFGFTEAFDSEAFSDGGSLSVTVGGPIYSGGRLSSAIRRAMAQRDAARASLHDTRHTIQQNVRNAYADLAAATARIEASQRQIRAARVAFRGVREEATLGARTTLDVLDAEQELLNAQANLISAQASQAVAAYSVLQATGRLTAKDLRLNVKIYDPEAYYNLVKDGPALRSSQGQALDRVLRKLNKD
ncbi:MAG: TolC family outer membrane protein [Pseudomonadota bacterium]